MKECTPLGRIYRAVWRRSRGVWMVASELARGLGKGNGRRKLSLKALLMLVPLALFPPSAMTAPSGGHVVSGAGTISQSGATTTINQSSQNVSLSWQSFNVAPSETVNFRQPNASALAVNRIYDTNGTTILGHLNANGQIYLINPNGILFGNGAQVNVGGLVASTLDTADDVHFSGNGTGSVVNEGTINAAHYVALLGKSVTNSGVITARLGTVALGAGNQVSLTFSGNSLVKLKVDKSVVDTLAANHGLIRADGGTVFMNAGARDSLLASVVNNDGVVEARTVENKGGTITLLGGMAAGTVNVGGTLDASAKNGGIGGHVVATAHSVAVGDDAQIDATGTSGGGTINIGGGWQGSGSIPQATTVSVAQMATLDASATGNGDGGLISVWSDVANPGSSTSAHGALLATGGTNGGNGGQIETSGHVIDVNGIAVNASAPNGAAGQWLLDPYNVVIGSAASGDTYSPPNFSPSTQDSTILASDIASALNGGSNVTITTGSSGSSLGDITVNSAITKSSGSTNVTLTLQAADSIIVNQAISDSGGTGKLNVNLLADNDNGTHDGIGVVMLFNSISTGGGNLQFGDGSTMSINSVNTLVGGDVYVGGSSAINLTTGGGNVTVNGQMIIANTNGLTIDTTGTTNGNVSFGGLLDSGNTYAYISSASIDWASALSSAASGTQGAVGSTFLATPSSRLSNSVASATASYQSSWLGGERVLTSCPGGLCNTWYWVAGSLGLANSGTGTAFFTQNGTTTTNGSGGSAINGAYTNWNGGEPNDYNGSNLTSAGAGEWVMQFTGSQGQWNDLNPTNAGSIQGYVKETELAASPLTINAGSTGTVTFSGAVGGNKALASLNVTAASVGINGGGITTEGAQTYTGNVTLGAAATTLTQTNANTDFTLQTGKSITNATGGGAGLTVKTTGSIILNTGSSISSAAGALDTVLWSDSNASGNGAIDVKGSTITTNGGYLAMAGGNTSTNGIPDGYADAASLTSTVGVNIESGSSLSTGGGYVLMRGKNTDSTSHANGISIDGTISAGSGNVTAYGESITRGINIGSDGKIATTSGSITLNGTSSGDIAVMLQGANPGGTDILTTGSGAISVTGSGNSSYGGVRVENARLLSSSGSITLDGANSGGSGIAFDTYTILGYNSGGSSTSDITLVSDSVNLSSGTIESSGTLTIEPKTAGTSIGIAGGSGTLSLPASYFSTNFTNGFSGITVGNASAGDITVGTSALTYNDPLTLKTAGNIIVNSGASLTGGSGEHASLVLWSDADATNGGYVQLANTGTTAPITTNGGGLWIGGGSGTASWTPYSGGSAITVGDGYAQGTSSYGTGVYLGSGAITTSGGNVAIYGKTDSSSASAQPDGTGWTSGIYTIASSGKNTSIDSGTGTILMDAVNILQNSTSGGDALYLNGANITSAATSGDAVTLIGDSSGAYTGSGGRGAGVTMVAWTNQPVSISATGGGNIVIDGTSSSANSGFGLNYGVRVTSSGASSQITTTHGGNISITGVANSSGANYAVGFETASDSISSSGNLSITGTNKPIFLTGPVSVTGTTSLSASGHTITAYNAGNDFTGAVSATGTDLSLRDTNALVLAGSTISGNLTLQTGGALTQTGALTVSGTTGITAGGGNDVTLDNSSNDFTGAVSVVSGNNVNLVDSNALRLGSANVSGTFSAQAGGALTLSGSSTFAGAATMSGTSVDLGTASLAIGNNLSIEATTGDMSPSGNFSITKSSGADATLTLKAAGYVALAASGYIGTSSTAAASGSTSTISSTSFKLNVVLNPNSNTGDTTYGGFWLPSGSSIVTNGGDVTIGGGTNASGQAVGRTMSSYENNALIRGVTVNGSINAGGGNVAIKGTASSTTTFSRGVSIADSISTIGSGTISVDGTAVITNGNTYSTVAGVTLDQGNVSGGGSTGSLSTVNGDITITGHKASGSGGIYMAQSGSITTTGTGNLILSTDGKLDAQGGQLQVGGTTSMSATGADIVANNSSNDFTGAVSVGSGNNVSLTDTNAMILGTSTISGNLTLQTGGALTQNGALAVGGTTSITAGSANDVTLDNTGNDFTGVVSVVSGNNVSLRDTNALELAGSTISGNLTLQTGGALTQSGALTVSGTTSITAGSGNDVTLDDSSNDFTGTVSVASVRNLALVDGNGMTLGAINASGTVNVATLTGDLGLSGAINTTDTTSSAVTLNAGKNSAAGTAGGGNVTVSGGSVSVGAGGRATLYSGSVSGSTGLTTLVGSGSGNFRYDSDETSSGYDAVNAALGSGAYAIYREQPTITVTANDASKSYDGLPYSGGNGVSYAGLVNGDSQSILNGTLAYGGTSQGATSPGTYSIVPSGLSNWLGYTLSYSNGVLTINLATLTISGNVGSSTYTTAAQTNGFTVSGLLGSSSVTGVSGLASGTNVGTYTDNLSGATGTGLGNYNIVYQNGSLTINPAQLTYTANAASMTYGGSVPALSGTVTGFVGGDTMATATTGTASFTTSANGTSSVGSYAIDGSGLTANHGNYTFVQAAGNATALNIELGVAPQGAVNARTADQSLIEQPNNTHEGRLELVNTSSKATGNGSVSENTHDLGEDRHRAGRNSNIILLKIEDGGIRFP